MIRFLVLPVLQQWTLFSILCVALHKASIYHNRVTWESKLTDIHLFSVNLHVWNYLADFEVFPPE